MSDQSLGLDSLTKEIAASKPARQARPKKAKGSAPARSSLRGKGLAPDGSKAEKKVSDFVLRNPFYDEFGIFGSDPNSKELNIARLRKMDRLGNEPVVVDGMVSSLVPSSKKAPKTKATFPATKKQFLARLKLLSIRGEDEGGVQKVVPERVRAIGRHLVLILLFFNSNNSIFDVFNFSWTEWLRILP